MPSGYGEVSTGNTPCPFVCRGQPMLIPRPQRWLPLASASEIWSFMFQKNGGLRYGRKKALLHSCWMHFGGGFQRNLYHLSPVEAPSGIWRNETGIAACFPTTPWIQENLREKSCFPIRKRPRWRKQPLPRSCRGSCAVASLCFPSRSKSCSTPSILRSLRRGSTPNAGGFPRQASVSSG